MHLTKTSKFLGAIGIALSALVFNANAQEFTILETQTCNFPLSATSWQSSCQVSFYDGNGVLEEVTATLSGGADSDLVLVNQSPSEASVEAGFVGADILASWSISGQNLSLNALPTGTFAPPGFSVAGNTTAPLIDVSGADEDSITKTGAANPDVAIYNGTGMFTVDIAADGVLSNFIRGGNVSLDQDTEAFATLEIQYKGTMVPEPNGSLMGAFALLGLIGFRGRR